MKKLLLTVVMLTAAFQAAAAPIDPLAAFGAAPLPPTTTSSVPGMGTLPGMSGIPDVSVGFAVSTVDQKLTQQQTANIGTGSAGTVYGTATMGQAGTQTATGSATATGKTR